MDEFAILKYYPTFEVNKNQNIMKNIYELDLLEVTSVDLDITATLSVMRVPGGWIFTESSISGIAKDTQERISSVFVPYNDEFNNSAYFNMTDPSIM